MKISGIDSQSMQINGFDQIKNGSQVSGISSDISSSSGAVDKSGANFADTLSEAINHVNKLHVTANTKAQELATGKTDNIADVMLASEKADIALRVMVQVRNKIIDAYQEIMRMQV